MNILELIAEIPGVISVKPDTRLSEMNIVKVGLDNHYTVSILFNAIEEPAFPHLVKTAEVAILNPLGEIIHLNGEQITMCTERELITLIKSLTGKPMAHIINEDLAKLVKQLKDVNEDTQGSFKASFKYSRLLSGNKKELILGATRYHLEFETIHDDQGLLFCELHFRVSGRAADLLKFIYALDAWESL